MLFIALVLVELIGNEPRVRHDLNGFVTLTKIITLRHTKGTHLTFNKIWTKLLACYTSGCRGITNSYEFSKTLQKSTAIIVDTGFIVDSDEIIGTRLIDPRSGEWVQ